MFDNFDLFETCEEYYNDWEEQAWLDEQYELSKEDQAELDELFG